jgi:hypothetical protein
MSPVTNLPSRNGGAAIAEAEADFNSRASGGGGCACGLTAARQQGYQILNDSRREGLSMSTPRKEQMVAPESAEAGRLEWVEPQVRRLEAAGAEDAVGPNVDAVNPS